MSREAAVIWSAIAEPLDEQAEWLVETLGASAALAWVRRAATDPVAASLELAVPPSAADKTVAALGRWLPRLREADPDRLLERAARVGASVLTPGEPGWPAALDSWGRHAPFALWVRGAADLDAAWTGSLALVGSRASTSYGDHVAGEIAAAAADRGIAVISGGAYGIDAAAHRGALAGGGTSVAVLAGGVDRLYPSGNAGLLERLMEAGAVVSEQPPGFAPHRHRFLSRNRLIAAARATVVVEAGVRSGALSTARHALTLSRPLGAVPGPVTSASSAGCHALLRGPDVTLIGNPRDALELALPIGSVAEPSQTPVGLDFETPGERQAYDAIPRRGGGADAIATAAGLAPGEALTALGRLSARGLVERDGALWRRVPTRRKSGESPDKSDNPLHTGGGS